MSFCLWQTESTNHLLVHDQNTCAFQMLHHEMVKNFDNTEYRILEHPHSLATAHRYLTLLQLCLALSCVLLKLCWRPSQKSLLPGAVPPTNEALSHTLHHTCISWNNAYQPASSICKAFTPQSLAPCKDQCWGSHSNNNCLSK